MASTPTTPEVARAERERGASHCLALSPAERAVRFRAIRRATETLAAPLAPEDTVVQSMPDVSPAKWHLAHTAWFFETFVWRQLHTATDELRDGYGYLFNSYYNAIGARHARQERGLLSRPLLHEVLDYRQEVTERIAGELAADTLDPALQFATELGLHHEQQHQELLLTDIQHVLSVNPLRPAYRADLPPTSGRTSPLRWHAFPGGMGQLGVDCPSTDFAFDNESPRHDVLLRPFRLASRPVTCGEYAAFIADNGYTRPDLWLADGWALVQTAGWNAPLYWELRDGAWWEFTLAGMRRVDEASPVAHVSYFEADAYARWAGARLPSEAEWERAAQLGAGNTADTGVLHPRAAAAGEELALPVQMIGDVWEWTASPYLPYPGFLPARGALGEYNGKFMCNQFVLRGGSCVTPSGHLRTTYRNFFPPAARWQWSGIRLAQEGGA